MDYTHGLMISLDKKEPVHFHALISAVTMSMLSQGVGGWEQFRPFKLI